MSLPFGNQQVFKNPSVFISGTGLASSTFTAESDGVCLSLAIRVKSGLMAEMKLWIQHKIDQVGDTPPYHSYPEQSSRKRVLYTQSMQY